MKDLDKDIEKQISQSFNEQDFDIQDAWLEDMSSMLDDHNKKDKRKILFWLFPGFLALCAAGLFWYNSAVFENEKVNTESVKGISHSDDTNLSSQKEPYEFIYTELACEPHEVFNDESKKGNIKIDKKHKNELKKNKTESSVKGADPSFWKTTINKEKLASLSYSDNKEANKMLTESKKQNISSILKDDKEIVKSETNSKAKKFGNKINSNIQSTNKVIVLDNKIGLNKKTTENKLDKNEKNQKIEEVSKIEKIDSLENPLVEFERTDPVQEKLIDTTNREKEVKLKKELGLTLAINAGPSFLFRNFKSENEKRSKEELNKIAWNLNLELYKTFRNNIILGTGVNITNYGEKIDYSSIKENLKDTVYQAETHNYFNLNISKVGQNIVYDTTAIVYYDTTLIITDSIYENTAILKANGTTNFTYIEIPLMIGYRILDTKKWKLNAMTGISTGFLIHSKGSYINDENLLEPAANNKVVFNYLLTAQLGYNAYKNINLSLSPSFKYNLNNMSTIQSINKKYYSFGVNAGVFVEF